MSETTATPETTTKNNAVEWGLDASAALGAMIFNFFTAAGRLAQFTGHGLYHCVVPPFFPRLLWRQIVDIGY